MKHLVSIIIRTLNEEKYLEELLTAINNQKLDKDIFKTEIVLVDSGSIDRTLNIAQEYNLKIVHIKKQSFSFGRSLNLGCSNASGSIFVFISGHCVPINDNWLTKLINPVIKGYEYSYGRQIGRDSTLFSEQQVFDKQYPKTSYIPQNGYFCNNANSAISKGVWKKYGFNENITGCEDMDLAKKYVNDGGKVAYVAESCVFHIHNENWLTIKRRYEREALALQSIMPEVRLSIFDTLNYFFIALIKDLKAAIKYKIFLKNFFPIVKYRLMQYSGSYIGNNKTTKISKSKKIEYFYPRKRD